MTATDAFNVLAGLRLTDGRTWASAADGVQLADARALLDSSGPRRHWIGRPRGYSKTGDLAGVLLAKMVTGAIHPDTPAYIAAASQGQAGLVLDSIEGFVNRSNLSHLIDIQSLCAVHRGSGARIILLPADGATAYGIRCSWLVLEELANWDNTRKARKFFDSVITALPKIPDSVGVVTTTAGTPSHFSYGVYQQALKEHELWRVSMTHTQAPWTDPKEIEAERRARTESYFARVWENRWSDADDALVTAADLQAAAVLDGPLPPVPGIRYAITLDVGMVNDRTVIVVAHKEIDGGTARVVVDFLCRWKGTRRNPVSIDEVEAAIVDLHGRYPGSVLIDPAKAEYILQRLRKHGMPIHQFDFTTTSVGLLAGVLLRALRSRTLSLPKDEVLLEELASVRIVENSAGVPRLSHDSSGHDDHAVALALAIYQLTNAPAITRPLFHDDFDRATAPNGRPFLPVQAIGAGVTAMPDSVRRDLDDEDGPAPGATAASPFA